MDCWNWDGAVSSVGKTSPTRYCEVFDLSADEQNRKVYWYRYDDVREVVCGCFYYKRCFDGNTAKRKSYQWNWWVNAQLGWIINSLRVESFRWIFRSLMPIADNLMYQRRPRQKSVVMGTANHFHMLWTNEQKAETKFLIFLKSSLSFLFIFTIFHFPSLFLIILHKNHSHVVNRFTSFSAFQENENEISKCLSITLLHDWRSTDEKQKEVEKFS